MNHKLFVYGTLLSRESNWSHYLKNANFLGIDTIEGEFTMVSLEGFPGVIPTGKGKIKGEVYEVDENTYKGIEYLEGYHLDIESRFYDKMKVNTKYGKAEMYVLDKTYLVYPVIESGNWRER